MYICVRVGLSVCFNVGFIYLSHSSEGWQWIRMCVCVFDTLCVYTCTVVVGAYGLGMSTMKTGEKVAFN